MRFKILYASGFHFSKNKVDLVASYMAGTTASPPFLPTLHSSFFRVLPAGSRRGRTRPRPVPGSSCSGWQKWDPLLARDSPRRGRNRVVRTCSQPEGPRGAGTAKGALCPGLGIRSLGPGLTLCSCVTSGKLLTPTPGDYCNISVAI